MQVFKSIIPTQDCHEQQTISNVAASSPEVALKELLLVLSQSTGIAITGIYILNHQGGKAILSHGIQPGQINNSNPFFRYVKQQACDLEVNDASLDIRFKENNRVSNLIRVKYFKNICFFNNQNELTGFLFLMQEKEMTLSVIQLQCVKILHQQILRLLEEYLQLEMFVHTDIDSIYQQLFPELKSGNNASEDSTVNILVNQLKENLDYKYALDEASIVAITDTKGIITYVNNNFCKISKFERKELIGQDHKIINSGFHSKEFIRNLWRTIAKGNTWKGEIKNKAKDGSTYWVDTVIVPFLNEQNKPYQYVAIRADITSRKIAEENLVKSLKETSDYKYALDEASIVAITNANGIIKYVNDNFCKISKYSREELIGQDHRIINSGFHSKDFIRQLWTTISSGKIWKGELKNKAKDGSTYWVDTVIIPFLNNDGVPYQYVAIRSDITQAKESEESIRILHQTLLKNEKRFRALIENGTDIVTILDKNMVTQYRSPSAKRITGWDDDKIDGNTKALDRIHKEDLDGVKLALMKVLSKNGSTVDVIFRTLHKQGHFLWLEGTLTNQLHDDSLNGLVFNLRDVSATKNSEILLLENKKQISDILERIHDGFIALDNDFNYTYLNKAISRMTGMQSAELIGKNIWEVFPEAVGTETYHAIVTAMRTNQYQTNIDFFPKLNLWQENHIYPTKEGLAIFIKDISFQKTAEQTIKKAHDQLSYHLLNTPLALIEYDQNFTITNWSPQATKFFGWQVDETIGKHFSEINLVFDGDLAFVNPVAKKLQSGKIESANISNRNNKKDGSVIYCEWYISVCKNEADNVSSIMCLVQDITERKLAEQSLKLSEERFDAFMNASPAIAWILDEQGRHIYMNNSWENLFQIKKEALLGKTVFDFLPGAIAEKINESNKQVLFTNESSTVTDSINIGGRQHYANTFKFPFKNSAGQILLGGMAIDITEQKLAEKALKESEEKYRVLIEEAIDGIVVYCPQLNKFINVNKKICELLGYSAEELLNMEHTELLLDETLAGTHIGDALRNNRDGIMLERQIQCSNGNMIDVEVSIKLMPGGNYLCYIRDFTDRKKAALEIVHLNEALEQKVTDRTLQLEMANKDLEAFSYSVSHDLRTPLRAINGYASIIEEDYNESLDKEGKRLLNEVRSNAKKMGMLIDDLLTFSRMGRKLISATTVNMTGLCSTAFDELQESNKRQVDFELHPLADAEADYALIKQVIINLLSNAIKYSSKAEFPKVIISSKINEVENEVVFSVKDNGVGFDMKYVSKLFGVFQRLHSNDEFEGTGVGLATVQRIINKHGGRVWAESAPDKGATFYFTLPYIDDKE
ncbi:MAG: PAS domain S-box protein [Bacteroidota bacterium]